MCKTIMANSTPTMEQLLAAKSEAANLQAINILANKIQEAIEEKFRDKQ